MVVVDQLVVLVLVPVAVLEVVLVLLVLVVELLVSLAVRVVVVEASGPRRSEFSSRQVLEKRTFRTSMRAPTRPPPVAS